jgi:hypothetical protein
VHSGRPDDVSAQRHFRQIFDDHDNLPSERGLTVKLGADEERTARQAHLRQAESEFDPPPFDAVTVAGRRRSLQCLSVAWC